MSEPNKEKSAEATDENTVSEVTAETEVEVESELVPGEDVVVEAEAVAEDIAEEVVEEVVEEEEPPSAEELLQADVAKFKDKWLRAVAETENLRKRSRKELADNRRFAQADILRSFLVVQDNMERALQSMDSEDNAQEVKSLREGVEMIVNSFHGVLKDKGVTVMEAKGSVFDPSLHEAIGQMPAEDVAPDQVLEVVQQGYKFGEMVLRAARVIVSG